VADTAIGKHITRSTESNVDQIRSHLYLPVVEKLLDCQ
jgi:hypothetical protein